jgi:hypothetical protein
MPTRNMVAANQSIFSNLDEFCAIRSDQIRNAGKRRWITTDKNDREFLKNATALAQISLAPGIKLAHYCFEGRSFLVVSGLEVIEPPRRLDQEELRGGVLTLFLSEQNPSPTNYCSD